MENELTPDKIFGERIREIRRSRHITQKKLAQDAGISNGYLNRIEHGKGGNVGMVVVFKLMALLNCSLLVKHHRGKAQEMDSASTQE